MPQAIPLAAASIGTFLATPLIAGITVGHVVAVGVATAGSLITRTQNETAGAIGSGLETPRALNTPSSRASVKQSTPVQSINVGEVRRGGPIHLLIVKAPWLYVGWFYGSLPVSEFRSLYVGDRLVRLFNDGTPVDEPYRLSDGSVRLQVAVQTGALGQGINPLVESDLLAECGADFILPGLPNCVAKCHWGADLDEHQLLWGGGIPDLQWLLRGTPLPDPRDPTHVVDYNPRDVEALYAAIDSWRYSNNAAQAQLFWAHIPYGLRIPPQQIGWSNAVPQVEVDDERVPLKGGGTERRHTVDGMITLDQKPNVVMDGMFASNRGFKVDRAGKFWVSSARPQEPVLTITDEMLRGGLQFRRLKPKQEMVNDARATFVSPERNYKDAEARWPATEEARAALQAIDGEPLEQSPRLPFVTGWARAHRLLKAEVDDRRLPRQLVCVCDMRAWGIKEGDVVRRWSRRYPRQNGLYIVDDWAMDWPPQAISLVLAPYDGSLMRAWNAQTDEPDFTATEEE